MGVEAVAGVIKAMSESELRPDHQCQRESRGNKEVTR